MRLLRDAFSLHLFIQYKSNRCMGFFAHTWFDRRFVGTTLSILAGLAFFLLCMLLPLVGPAGSRVEHASENEIIFLSWLGITLLFSVASVLSRWERVRKENEPRPIYSLLLCIMCIMMLLIQLAGGFAI